MQRGPTWFRRAVTGVVAGLTATAGVSALAATAAHADSTFTLTRIAGSDRYATAGAFDAAAFPTGSPTVYLADGIPGHQSDALSGSGWGGVNTFGALLTDNTNSVPAPTMAALSANHVHNIVLLGQTAAITSAQQTQLSGAGFTVTRIGGTTRYDTMQMINDSIPLASVGHDNSSQNTAILASGEDNHLVDALSAGGVAYGKHFPVILTNSTTTALQPQAQEVITHLGITHLIVVGGTAAIPASQYQPAPTGVTKVDVEAGANRSATSMTFSDFAITNGWAKNSHMELARGDDGADALASAPYAGTRDAWPTCVTNSTTDVGSCTSFASEHAATLTGNSTVAGGTAAVPDSQVAAVQTAGRTVASNQTYTATPSGSATEPVTHVVSETVTGLSTAPVDIQLFACGQVQAGPPTTFTGTNPGGTGNFAQPSQGSNTYTGSATIGVVNGASVTPTAEATGVTPSGGSVSFSFTDTASECVVPVVFQQGSAGPTQDLLPLGTNNQPTVPFGVGQFTTFLPPQAAAGSFGGGGAVAPTSTVLADGPNFFVTSAGTYNYSSADTFQLWNGTTCATDTFSDFQSRLTMNDNIGGVFNPSATSTFCLNDRAPFVPSAIEAFTNPAGGVQVWFNQPNPYPGETANAVTAYNVYRAPATPPAITGAPYTCPTSSPTGTNASPQTSPPSAYTLLGTVKATGSTTDPDYIFTDTTASPGSNASAPNAFCYAVSSVATNAIGGSQVGSGRPAGADNPPPNTSGIPTATAPAPMVPAAAVAAGAPVFASASSSAGGRTVTVNYNQPIDCTTVDGSAGAHAAGPPFDFRVQTTSGGITNAQTIASLTCSSTGGPGGNGQVVITLAAGPAFSAGDTVRVDAQTGQDGDTVGDTTHPQMFQPTTDAVQATAGA